MLELERQGKIRVEYNLTKHARPIMMKAYQAMLKPDQISGELAGVRKNANGQIRLLDILRQHPGETFFTK